MQDMPDKQTLRVAGYYAIGVVGSLALSLGLTGPAKFYGPGAMGAVAVVSVAWALAFTGMAWRRTDEAARAAHKTAWFWGAPFALMALVIVLPFVAVLVFHARFGPIFAPGAAANSPWTVLLAGVVLAAAVQALGYLVVWTAWWLRRR
jgi:hypothetical protein